MFSQKEIEEAFLKGSSKRYSPKNESLYKDFIDSQISLNIPFKEKVYCFINNFTPICKLEGCTNIPSFANFVYGYKECCSAKCSTKLSSSLVRESSAKNIVKKAEGLVDVDIADKIFNGELKIVNWRSIPQLDKYKNFNSFNQLYKHLVLKENQICEHCNEIFDIDHKTKEPRRCTCKLEQFKVLASISKLSDDLFLEKLVENKLYMSYKQYPGLNEAVLEEYKSRFEWKYWSKSISENIYCLKESITNKPSTEFINLKLGYKNKSISVDYSKSKEDIEKQFYIKYNEPSRVLEYQYWKYHGKPKSSRVSFKDDILPIKLERLNVLLLEPYKKVSSSIYKFKCLGCNSIFRDDFFNNVICRKCNPRPKSSKQEKEICDFIKSIYNGEVLENDRTFAIELDIFLPDLNIAIEYNGLYWHSVEYKHKNYHLNKTNICEDNGIHLIHIFENEWIEKEEIVKSILRSKLGVIQNKIYARKCEIREVPSKESNKFLDCNHIQGRDNASIRFGLYYNDNLVQLMTFKRSHRSREKYLELKRSCSVLNTSVIGGFSKLLKYSKEVLKEDIVTFADRRYSYKENVYSKIGKYISTIQPNHFYHINGELKSREGFQKHLLEDILDKYDDNLSAIENCHRNNIFEVYDSGNHKYIL
ncbi:MAG: hypothetical protein ACYDD5_00180 [Sulfuricurvum sp.]